MERELEIPRDLKIVAYLFIIFGIIVLIEILLDLINAHLNINFGVLQLPCGIGLLRLRRGWRTAALILLWFGLIANALFCLGVIFGSPVLTFFGQPVGLASKPLSLALAAGLFILMIWEYRVLTREDVRRLFFDEPRGETIAEHLARGRQR